MLLKVNELTVVTSWTNGRKAVVELLQDSRGTKVIKKVYRPGFRGRMFREYVMATYVSSRTTISPQVFGFRPWRNEILLQYLPGQRVFEWVLSRFGQNLCMAEFTASMAWTRQTMSILVLSTLSGVFNKAHPMKRKNSRRQLSSAILRFTELVLSTVVQIRETYSITTVASSSSTLTMHGPVSIHRRPTMKT